MAYLAGRFFYYHSKYPLEGNSDYFVYPNFFFQRRQAATGAVGASRPVHVSSHTNLVRRRINREHFYPHVFFNSFISLKTTAWFPNLPTRMIRTPQKEYLYQAVFFESYKTISPAVGASFMPGLSGHVVDRRRRYNRSKRTQYPSYFAKPAKVPDTAFESDDWTDVPTQPTTWTEVK